MAQRPTDQQNDSRDAGGSSKVGGVSHGRASWADTFSRGGPRGLRRLEQKVFQRVACQVLPFADWAQGREPLLLPLNRGTAPLFSLSPSRATQAVNRQKLLDAAPDYYYNVVEMRRRDSSSLRTFYRLARVMAALPNTAPSSRNPTRRSFLWSFLSFGLTPKTRKSEKPSETVYRFLTPECEVRMGVEYFPNSSTKSLRFRERLSNRAFCLSANGEEDRSCLDHFSGSMAIARYDFRPRLRLLPSLQLRERVRTIDYDSRLAPHPPFERTLAAERNIVSDIQVFGYDRDDPRQAPAAPLALWCLLRQDLFLNDQSAAFLVVHWKHTFESISLVDVIPGDQTQLLSE